VQAVCRWRGCARAVPPTLLDLDTELRFLALVIAQRVKEYDGCALRWPGRWISETPGATIGQAAAVAALLAELPAEPTALEEIQRSTSD
jgi:hypothetical protein